VALMKEGEPMSDANKALTRQFLQRISAGDLSAVDELVSDHYVEHEQLPGLASGKAGVRQLFEMFHSAFDQARVEVDDMIAEVTRFSSWRG
jgi:ketosteroid isomerase-like protein